MILNMLNTLVQQCGHQGNICVSTTVATHSKLTWIELQDGTLCKWCWSGKVCLVTWIKLQVGTNYPVIGCQGKMFVAQFNSNNL